MSETIISDTVSYRNLDFLGYPGYRVGDDGSVWSIYGTGYYDRKDKTTERWIQLKPWIIGGGYKYVTLCRNKQQTNFPVHHLILFAFVGPKPEGLECRHLDDIKTNNRAGNLCWGTRIENQADRGRNGAKPDQRGENNSRAKLTSTDVLLVRELFRSGVRQKDIADRLNISKYLVYDIVSYRSWAHLP